MISPDRNKNRTIAVHANGRWLEEVNGEIHIMREKVDPTDPTKTIVVREATLGLPNFCRRLVDRIKNRKGPTV